MNTGEAFLWGAAGSLAVEVVRLYHLCDGQRFYCPARYRKFSFWLVRIMLASIAGGLVVAYEVETAILAMNIGASAPLIIAAFSSRLPSVPAPLFDEQPEDRPVPASGSQLRVQNPGEPCVRDASHFLDPRGSDQLRERQ